MYCTLKRSLSRNRQADATGVSSRSTPSHQDCKGGRAGGWAVVEQLTVLTSSVGVFVHNTNLMLVISMLLRMWLIYGR